MKRVAVIGAGPAGLSAAWTLTSSGWDVVVYEAQDRPGGLLRTEFLDGAHVDMGVQLVASVHTTFFELVRQAGAGGLMRKSPGRDALWRRGRPHSITYGSVPSMIASRALPTGLKLRLGARYVPFLKTTARRLDASDPAGSGGAEFDGESIGEWGTREIGDDFVELLVYPLLAAYYGVLPEETSAGVYHAIARVGMDVSVYGAEGGFGAVADAIVAALESRGTVFRNGTAVGDLRAAIGAGVAVDGEAYDGAVIAVPANRAAALLRPRGQADSAIPLERRASAPADGAAQLQEWLAAVRERPAITVAYRLDREFPGDYFGLSFPRVAEHGGLLAALCIQSRKLEGLVPAGGDAVVVMPAPQAVPRLAAMSDDDLANTLLAEVEKAVSGITRRVTHVHVARFDDACTVFDPGFIKRLQRLDASWLPVGVALAGDYLVAPSVEGAVLSGRRAAERVLNAIAD